MKSIPTARLDLVPQTREQTLAHIQNLPPEYREQVSAAYLAMLENSAPIDPWIHGFALALKDGTAIGNAGFKGAPDAQGMVELAYVVDDAHQNKGYATEAAGALTRWALDQPDVRVVRAHTLQVANSSNRVLTKTGFHKIGDVIDPEDGPVWRWERGRT
jgi:ribosomal-protein-alanine N-acetyltransferase